MKKLVIVLVCLFVAAFVFAQFKDGVFSAKDKPDNRGYVADIKITVKNGKITKVDYNEEKSGKPKRTDNAYNNNMKKVSGISWKDATEKLEATLVQDQDPDKIDSISGATELTKRFKELAKEALGKAK